MIVHREAETSRPQMERVSSSIYILPPPFFCPLFPTWQQRLETYHSSHLHICRRTSHFIPITLTLTMILTLTCVTSHPLLADSNAPRKRRSRWGDAKADLPGLPTAISATGVSQAQLDNYAIHLRLEEINGKLRLNDFVPPERERYVKLFFLTQAGPYFFAIAHHHLPQPMTDKVDVRTLEKSGTAKSLRTSVSDSSIVP